MAADDEREAGIEGKLGRTPLDATADVLAAAVAHDLNNVLTGLDAGLDLAAAAAARGRLDHLGEELDILRAAADRLRQLSRDLEARAGVPRAPAPMRAPATPFAGRARILVVDDEPALGELVAQALADAYDVAVVGTAHEALARLAREPFDVLLCDLQLPDLDAPAFHEAVRRAAPAIADRTVFMTGGAFSAAARAFVASEPGPVLPKPFGVAALRAAIADMVGRGGEAEASAGVPHPPRSR